MKEISKEQFLSFMKNASYALVDDVEIDYDYAKVYKVRMDYGVNSYDYPDGQPAFIDVSDYKYGDHIYLGELLDDEDVQYWYEVDRGRPVFTIESANPRREPVEIKIMFLVPLKK